MTIRFMNEIYYTFWEILGYGLMMAVIGFICGVWFNKQSTPLKTGVSDT